MRARGRAACAGAPAAKRAWPQRRRRHAIDIRGAIYFGLHGAAGGQLPRRYAQLRRAEARGTLEGTHLKRLGDILRHAQTRVPYYAEAMRGIEIDGADPVALLRSMPVLTKPLIRAHFERLRADDVNPRRTYVNASGGSTGEPVKVLQDRAFWEWSVATQILHARWAGHELGAPEVGLWGSERDVLQNHEKRQYIVANWLTRRRSLNAYRMTPVEMEAFVADINRRRPSLVVAYAQALYELALFIEERRLPVVAQNAIVTTSETLHPWMRSKIEDVFGARVLNRYGCRELGDVAGQCPAREGLHVFPWANYVEVLDERDEPVPPGDHGELVVTSLINFAMPLIRYKTGDRGVLAAAGSGCSCGRAGQVLHEVAGRNSDLFRRRDGTLVDPGFFMGVLEFRDWIRKFQVVQRDYDDVVVRAEQVTQPPHGDLEDIVKAVKAAMGDDCRVSFEFPARLVPGPSGKFRYTMSEIQHGSNAVPPGLQGDRAMSDARTGTP